MWKFTILFLCFVLYVTYKDNSNILCTPIIDLSLSLSLIYLAWMYMDRIDLIVEELCRFNI